ncbi:MAG: hypothetical protein ACKOWL_07970 [Sphingobacteriaceae bacterium]
MFNKDSSLLGALYGVFLPALVAAGQFLLYHSFSLQRNNVVYYFAAIALNLVVIRFAYTYKLERMARGLMASSFVVSLLIFYLSKQAI